MWLGLYLQFYSFSCCFMYIVWISFFVLVAESRLHCCLLLVDRKTKCVVKEAKVKLLKGISHLLSADGSIQIAIQNREDGLDVFLGLTFGARFGRDLDEVRF